MTTYYYSISTGKAWEEEEQYECICRNWKDFVQYCYYISYHFKQEVRASETKGYNNQAYYLKATSDFIS